MSERPSSQDSEDSEDVATAIGSLSIGTDGQVKYHGETAGSETEGAEMHRKIKDPKYLGLPYELSELANAFPFGLRDCPYTKQHFIPFLPKREQTMRLADLYYANAAWMYDPVVQDEFMCDILPAILFDGSGTAINVDALHPHRLSVFFMVLATGTLFDDSIESATIVAEQYHALACAALSLKSILDEASTTAVQALFMLVHFVFLSDRGGNERRWLLCGICSRIAQIVQRDSAGWNLEPAEVQRRRVLFWELFTWDAWTAVVNGRPPAMTIHSIDARFPEDNDPATKVSGEVELGFHAWKFRYSATCLSGSVDHVFNIRHSSYSALLDLDRKIRTFPVPSHLQAPVEGSEAGRSWSADSVRALQQYCILCEKESMLMYIHRSYFAQAVKNDSINPLAHKYASSVVSAYRSALRLISSLRGLYSIHPAKTGRVWFFWSNCFSACIILGALIVEAPGCELASNALQEFDQAYTFYEEGSRYCRPPATMTTLDKLRQRAHVAFHAMRTGAVTAGAVNGSRRSPYRSSQGLDELEVLEGRKSVIARSRSPSQSPSSQAAIPHFPESEVRSQGGHMPTLPSHSITDGTMGRPFINQFGDTHPSMVGFYQGYEGMDYEVPAGRYAAHHDYHQVPGPSMDRRPSTGGHSHNYGSQAIMPPPPHQAASTSYGAAGSGPHHQAQYQYAPHPGVMPSRNQDEVWRNFVDHLDL
ncbi:hypothetical protein GLOTRDRAFT_39370 [Gloeophyllum trabeum ATCC 11539]|uniref:Xylanolytic transcriptional activator regulatory domain-containing protein n=1 Tax=Gloeophyllum trabeum (strain ATCC 11539 / FP-39264 / Madison 617) TaxID=670483 RepID=S7RPI2_GLOTA|nr:uncharacterized protein GLOTRDRAFT_39370 [Gloeophyllum trabeum ATCC 11539]EPQ56450.1 hypothetical protein GLOTRDRAFT_39370 [Gloeophyllum trabeum ATCC 11539]